MEVIVITIGCYPFPATKIQKCIVHQVRNSVRYVSYKDLKKVTADLKPIYQAASENLGKQQLQVFNEKWGSKYPLIVRSWENNWAELSTFFKYPPEIRKIIYTTNMIESYHQPGFDPQLLRDVLTVLCP